MAEHRMTEGQLQDAYRKGVLGEIYKEAVLARREEEMLGRLNREYRELIEHYKVLIVHFCSPSIRLSEDPDSKRLGVFSVPPAE